MTLFRIHILFVFALSCIAAWPAAAQSTASAQLQQLDKTTLSGRLETQVSVYPAPDGKGQVGAPSHYPAQLLFERPDRFRIVIRAGEKNEYRVAAEGGIVRWRDLGSGFSGKRIAEDVADPFALALLATAGELLRMGTASELPVSKHAKLTGVRLKPASGGSGVDDAIVWFGSEQQPVGFEFSMTDGSRVFVSVLAFEQNPPLSPEDFRL